MAQILLDPEEAESIRVDAVNLIGRIGSENQEKMGKMSGKTLMPYLNNSTPFMQTIIIKNLGLIPYPEASAELIKLSLTTDEDTMEEIFIAVRNIGQPAIDILKNRYQTAPGEKEKLFYQSFLRKLGVTINK